MRRILIKDGIVVNADAQKKADVLIRGDFIEAVEADIPVHQDTDVIEAKGAYVMPGGIDVHTHFNIDVGLAKSCDDFYTGTVSAACGGTTTIIDHMGFGPSGCPLGHQLHLYQQYAKDSVIDYGFHGVIQHVDKTVLQAIPKMVREEGISSFKFYLTYRFKLEDAEILEVLEALQKSQALTAVHPENDALIKHHQNRFLASHQIAAPYHALSRPLECEAEAIARMINFAQACCEAPLYIVHLSNGLGLKYIELAKQRNQKVWAETCPQYLLLDVRCYEKQEALRYIMSPPLREAAENQKLWDGITEGSIDTVATDHCAFTDEQKNQGKDSFARCPNGIPGVEVRVPLMFSEGVAKGRISPSRFIDLISTKPAKLFGLFPQKGSLTQGADADIIIMDPKRQRILSQSALHSNAGYTPFEGFPITGWPVMTFLRGKIVAQEGRFVGTRGSGQFLFRKPFSMESAEIGLC